MSHVLRLHHCQPLSEVNGPGKRFVIWTQGCPINCPECFNPETHSSTGGYLKSATDLSVEIQTQSTRIEGVTLSGGEPLLQISAVIQLLSILKSRTKLSTLLFTGYEWEMVQTMPRVEDLTRYLDVLIAGRYIHSKRKAFNLIGSTNKSLHFFSSRYNENDLAVASAEVIIERDGMLTLSGIDPIILS